MLDHLYDYYICSYGNNFNSNVNSIEQIKKFKEKCLITSLTSIMLIIEQINFNNKPNIPGFMSNITNIAVPSIIITCMQPFFDFDAHKKLVPMQKGDVETTFADTTPLEKDYGFKPNTPLREGLRKFAEWYKEFYG